ncbi:hypothetical protein [Chitinophaga sp.]|uniref:hypothetical protein n=1 Tax=Chitinophaga sp. TaxID=1869181 RepID=UPI0031DD69F9
MSGGEKDSCYPEALGMYLIKKVHYIRFINTEFPVEMKNDIREINFKKQSPMAWNKYYVLIKGAGVKDVEDFLLQELAPDKEVNLFDTNTPQTLFAGEYNGCLILVEKALPFEFFDVVLHPRAKALVERFPEAEIGALLQHSTVGEYGYTLIKGGKRIRAKHGSEESVYFELGSPLPEEQESPDDPLFEEEELEEMREDGLSEREIREIVRFERDVRVPGKLLKRFFGVVFNELDPVLVKLTRYRRRVEEL